MEYHEIIQSAIISLKSNVMRTALTMLGIIIGIGSVIMIASIGQSAIAFVNSELTAFGTNYFQITPGADVFSSFGGASQEPITHEDADIDNVIAVAPIGYTSRILSANDQQVSAYIYGITEAGQELLKPELVYGELLTNADSNSRVMTLGIDAAEELFGEGVNPVGEAIRIDNARFRIVGVVKNDGALFGSFFNSAAVIPLQVLSNEIRGDDELAEIDISVANTDYMNQTMQEVESFLRDRKGIAVDEENTFTLTSFEESLDTVNTVTTLLTTLIAGISSISLVVGGVGVMNIMLVSVTERTKEIGLLKSIGAKEKDILTQFLIEAVVMTLIGGVIGILLGIFGALLVSVIVGIPFILSLPWIIIAVIASTLVGVGFGLYPARRAAALSPIDALRYE
ncbi:MAG TPA: ABC transporter permease [Candidatus Woesebacteria bacterium]|nr:ABC transporter permease [Candidatus Woesebacteria bacterium]